MARGRPRQHDLDSLLDDARSLWVEQGVGGLTMRELSARSGVGNGAIYHAFGSRDNVLAAVWAREAGHFLRFQRDLVEASLGAESPQDAVIAAALSIATYAETHEEASRLLLSVEATDLMRRDLGAEQRAEVDRLRGVLGDLVVELAGRLWQRTDRDAVLLVKLCLVDLPAKLLLSTPQPANPLSQHALTEAVRGITSVDPVV